MRNPDGGWDASLALRFARHGPRTALVANRHHGPARVQRPFYPEGPECVHAYLLHPPGGYVGGDSQILDVHCGRDAAVLLTTPAATKFYKSLGPFVRQRMDFTLAAGARLEWLPMEAIVFHEARVQSTVRIDLAAGASFAGWDIVCLGRPASHEPFASGVFDQRFSVWREGLPLWMEHAVYEGGNAVLQQKYGLGGPAYTPLSFALKWASSMPPPCVFCVAITPSPCRSVRMATYSSSATLATVRSAPAMR